MTVPAACISPRRSAGCIPQGDIAYIGCLMPGEAGSLPNAARQVGIDEEVHLSHHAGSG